jgi:hypothetical protein
LTRWRVAELWRATSREFFWRQSGWQSGFGDDQPGRKRGQEARCEPRQEVRKVALEAINLHEKTLALQLVDSIGGPARRGIGSPRDRCYCDLTEASRISWDLPEPVRLQASSDRGKRGSSSKSIERSPSGDGVFRTLQDRGRGTAGLEAQGDDQGKMNDILRRKVAKRREPGSKNSVDTHS